MYIYKVEDYGQLERIKELMSEKIEDGKKGITQEKLADKIEVDKSNVNKWFNKGVSIRKSNLIRIAEYLDCDIEFLTCKQNYPRKSKSSKIKLKMSYTDRYLELIKELTKNTSYKFNYTAGFDIVNGEVKNDYFVEDNKKYYYEYIEEEYGEMYYEVSINGGEYKKKTPTEMQDFANKIVSYISYELTQL